MLFQSRSRLVLVLLFVLLVVFVSTAVAGKRDSERLTVVGTESLGVVIIPNDFIFKDTAVGELSGITWDRNRGVYYVVADDRSEVNDARYYTVAIDLSDGSLDDGDVTFVDVTTMLDENRKPFELDTVDPEGIVLVSSGRLFISSEGGPGATPPTDPFVNRFNVVGKQNKAYPVPAKFLPDGTETFGVRENLGFESLTSSPNMRYLMTGTENALAQDGPTSTLDDESMSRILVYDMNPGRPRAEYVYIVSTIPVPPDPPDSFADNGLVELVGLDNTGTMIAMERSFAIGIGNTIKLFEIHTAGATNVEGIEDLYDEDTGTPADVVPVSKELIVDLADLGIDPDNVEGMALGPVLEDGRQTLILVSDNNFRSTQVTQFIALALDIEHAPEVNGKHGARSIYWAGR